MDDNSLIQLIEWIRSLPLQERQDKIESMKQFYENNTLELIKTMKKLEKVKDCPKEIINNAKMIVANNMDIMNSLNDLSNGVKIAEKKSDS